MSVKELFDHLWEDYVKITPSAFKVHQILKSEQDDILNDHIALRSFNHPNVNLEKLAQHFINLGYKECGEYHFEAKKLYAKHYEHSDPKAPKVFISHLLVEKLSKFAQETINGITNNLDENVANKPDFLYSGTHWEIKSETYLKLLEESEYAAWMYAWGYHANHFTVSINHLNNYESIESVNNKLKQEGFVLNSSGGEIKGSPEVYLEQSSTMADKYKLSFTDKDLEIPSCFYEFAKRYKLPNGQIYTGFVEASADKIFESTNNS